MNPPDFVVYPYYLLSCFIQSVCEILLCRGFVESRRKNTCNYHSRCELSAVCRHAEDSRHDVSRKDRIRNAVSENHNRSCDNHTHDFNQRYSADFQRFALFFCHKIDEPSHNQSHKSLDYKGPWCKCHITA